MTPDLGAPPTGPISTTGAQPPETRVSTEVETLPEDPLV